MFGAAFVTNADWNDHRAGDVSFTGPLVKCDLLHVSSDFTVPAQTADFRALLGRHPQLIPAHIRSWPKSPPQYVSA